MAFSIFPNRTSQPSARRRLLTRPLEVAAIGIAVAAIAGAIALPFLQNNPAIPRWMFRPFYTYLVIAAAASYLLGVGTIRRRRWARISVASHWSCHSFPNGGRRMRTRCPFERWSWAPSRSASHMASDANSASLVTPILMTMTMLGFPTRNRGYGEGRAVPNTSAPQQLMTPRESNNLTARPRKANAEIK